MGQVITLPRGVLWALAIFIVLILLTCRPVRNTAQTFWRIAYLYLVAGARG